MQLQYKIITKPVLAGADVINADIYVHVFNLRTFMYLADVLSKIKTETKWFNPSIEWAVSSQGLKALLKGSTMVPRQLWDLVFH